MPHPALFSFLVSRSYQRAAACLLVLSGSALALRAQSSPIDGRTHAVLDHLSQQSEDYARSIPDFVCSEAIHTTLRRHGKTRQTADYATEIHVIRTPAGGLDETFFITSFMGKPLVFGKPLATILYTSGGLSHGLPSYFAATRQACYLYTLRDSRIGFAANPEAGSRCLEPHSTVGFGLLDEHDDLLHGEVRHAIEDARRDFLPTFSTIDYTSIHLGERDYRVPSHFYAEARYAGDTTKTFEAHFTECRLYKVTATIHATIGPVADEPK